MPDIRLYDGELSVSGGQESRICVGDEEQTWCDFECNEGVIAGSWTRDGIMPHSLNLGCIFEEDECIEFRRVPLPKSTRREV